MNIGEVLAGKFRVDRILGTGGMGVVVAATHMQLHQTVALKFLLPHSLQNATVVERFLREARAAVRLRSEHVARVIDVGQLENGSPYIVMEYLDGRDLGDVLEQDGPQPVDVSVDYLTQACEAVAEAHALGIVHRDLKPRNLFLTRRVDGRPLVKVLDFGISKMDSGPSGNELSLTRTSEVVGSPNYMSPEQLRAARLADARSDVWSLGAILYELLSGRVPFVAETLTQLCSMVLTERPRPMNELRGDVPIDVAHIIERCLEKDPANRFQTVAGLVAALAPFHASGASSRGATRVLVQSVPPAALAVSDRSSAPIVSGTGGTSVAWGNAEPAAAPPRKRGMLVALIAMLGVLAAGGIGTAMFVMSHRPPHDGGGVAPSSGDAVTATPSVPTSAAPVVDATPTPTGIVAPTIPTDSAKPVDPASSHSSTNPRTPPSAKPPKPRPPRPRGGDDLPDDRH